MPFVDRLLRPIIPDVSTQIAALRTGELDFHANIPPEQWATLDNIAPKLLKSRYSSSCIMISFDNTKPPFDNVDMRRAMMIGTDLEGIRDAVYMGKGALHGMPLCIGTQPTPH